MKSCHFYYKRHELDWRPVCVFSLGAIALSLTAIYTPAYAIDQPVEFIELAQAASPNLPRSTPVIPPDRIPEPSPPKVPQESPSEIPLQTPPRPEKPQPSIPPESDTITVKRFIIEGNTTFTQKELDQVLQPYTDRAISFAELLQARSAITELYVKAGYITTGAYIPKDQTLQGEVAEVKIKVIEGRVEEIRVTGTRRLNPNYVRSRLQLGASKPLNERKLIDALRLLQADPLIDSISAELRAGVQPGTNILEVQVKEAPNWRGRLSTDNGRSPSVGSFRRGVGLTQANLLGLGDGLSVSYNNTDGSNGVDLSYTLPINPRNGTFNFSYGRTKSNIIEQPFDRFDIASNSRYYQFTFRQPIIQTPNQEFALSLIGSVNENQTSIGGINTPISAGADRQGRTRASALRFAQEYILQDRRFVFAARSQFSVGINAFGATINDTPPDSNFFAWRGQAQWVQLFGTYTDNLPTAPTLLVRTDLQFGDRPLLPTEQFGFGGLGSVRGYRQDVLLTDNGAFGTVELRLPVVRIPKWIALIQLIPFVDVATGWNSGDSLQPDPRTLASVGIGLQFIQSRTFSARLDWGIPLVNLNLPKRTWQENGIYFSIEFNPF
jgi:hemolysin activation/secretion protein